MKLIFACVLLLSSGCTVITYQHPSGAKLTYVAPMFGTKVFGDLDLQKGTLGSARSEQAKLVEAIEALAKARPLP